MLLMASVLPTFFLMAGKIYLIFAILMSFALIYFAGRLGKNQDNKSAKQLMIATILMMTTILNTITVPMTTT